MTSRARLRRVAVAPLLVLLLGVGAPARADTIVLRNGQELHGRVTIEGNKARIELDIGATLLVDRGEIAKTIVEGAAAPATGEAVAIPAELMARLKAREEIHELIEALLDEKEAARLKAEGDLAQKGREALPMVRAAFASGPPTQRLHLLRVLAAIGDPASLPKIIELLRNPNEKGLHVEAVKALAAIGGHDAAPLLTELLVNSTDDAVRLECLKALEELASPQGAPFVVEALRNDALRPAARAALARWDDPVLLLYLLPLLDEGTRESRERVAAWIARLVTPAHAVTLAKLVDFYDDDKEVAKLFRAGVMRLHKDFPVVGDVELLGAPQSSVRDSALEALRKVQKDRRRRGPTPRDWQDLRNEATQAHLVVEAVGLRNPLFVRDLAADLETSLKTPGAALQVKVDAATRQLALPPGPDTRPRDARPLLLRLDREQAGDPQAVRLVGVTAADLSVPGLDHALAPTRPGGAVLLSLAGLGEGREAVASRARRLALHALARSLRLPPCGDATCPSSALFAPQDLDAKSSRYCNACKQAFDAAWAAAQDVADFHYGAAAARIAAAATRAKSRDDHAVAAYLFERGLQPLLAIAQWKTIQALGNDPAQTALITKRIELLDHAEKWLQRKKAAPPPPTKGR